MPEKPPSEAEDYDLWIAEKALADALKLKGSQRFEALKRAGKLRYDAHKKRHENETSKINFRGRNDSATENESAIDKYDEEKVAPPPREEP
jgi:hypothetical protein